MTNQMNQNDPYAVALDPPEPVNVTYGELNFDMYFCALVKGQGKVVFDPKQHAAGQRRTAVLVEVIPLPETGSNYVFSRNFIAEIRGDGWLQVTLPSLRALNVADLKTLKGKYVRAESESYGSYTKKDGTEGVLTAQKFTAIYDTQDACLAAWKEENGDVAPPASAADVPLFPDANGNSSNGTGPNRNTALLFLPAIVRSARTPQNTIDVDALAQKLAETPLIKDHFTITSPEVIAEVQKAEAEPAF